MNFMKLPYGNNSTPDRTAPLRFFRAPLRGDHQQIKGPGDRKHETKSPAIHSVFMSLCGSVNRRATPRETGSHGLESSHTSPFHKRIRFTHGYTQNLFAGVRCFHSTLEHR